MQRHWKLLGLAGIAGVAATGVVVARHRREHVEYDTEGLRERLHERLADAAGTVPGDTTETGVADSEV